MNDRAYVEFISIDPDAPPEITTRLEEFLTERIRARIDVDLS